MSKDMSEMTVEELDAECAALERVEQSIVTILALKPGQSLTAEQVELIQFFEDRTRREEDTSIETFHRGYEEGLRRAAGADTAKLIEERDEARMQETTARLLGQYWQRQAFINGAQVCREMMARFVEQGGDAVTAVSIRANWRPTWGADPGTPSGEYFETAAPINIREEEDEA